MDSRTRARLAQIARPHAVGRRALLGGGLAGAGLAGLGPWGASTALAHGSSLFSLGVASGEPGPLSTVLWTRLAKRPLEGGGMDPVPVPVRWEVALDPRMRLVVRRGTTIARPESAHTARVLVEGLLPDRWYYYRFSSLREDSPIGRTRTFPLPFDRCSSLKFGLVSCQDYQNGYFSAYQALAGEDLDVVVHVGDYIYEYGPRPGALRQHNAPEIDSLSDYRNRYALYRLDPSLQAAHAAFPFVTTFDDHEVDNNHAGEIPEDGQTLEAFRQRKANAYQAYFEHMPLRPAAHPTGAAIPLYRRITFGRLAAFHVLDTRQYRTDQPCDDNLKATCAGTLDPNATMTGAEQEEWLFAGLDRSPATWNVIAQQVMFMRWDLSRAVGSPVPFFNMDAWDGYPAARQRILDFLAQRNPSNPIVLTGDIHSAWAAEIKEDFTDPASGTVAAEFVTTSITSDFPAGYVPLVQATLPSNPHIKFFDGQHHGYLRFTVTPERWHADFRAVESVLTAVSPVSTLKSFDVEAGYSGFTG
jgi:alkaline phosphatase D